MNKQERLYYGLSLAIALVGWILRLSNLVDVISAYRILIIGMGCVIAVYMRYAQRLQRRNAELEQQLPPTLPTGTLGLDR